MKSDELSIDRKEKSTKEFKRGNNKEALLLLNEALCYAVSKECMALAFAKRSAVYFRLKKYEECLLNIQWARENGYPTDKLLKLKEREDMCKVLLDIRPPEDDPWNFFKLSHPPNPKIPFIVDCLELKTTEKYGRGIYATRDLTVGDIISIEDSFMQHINFEGDRNFCASCDKTMLLNLLPCKKTVELMFCSEKCRDKGLQLRQSRDNKLYKSIEEKFGSREKLLEFLESVPDILELNYSIFDFDWSNTNDPEYGINQVKCLLSFKDPQNLEKKGVKVSRSNEPIKRMIRHVEEVTLFTVYNEKHCWQTVFEPLINHSCIPNVQRTQVKGKVIFHVIRPIKSGEQIFQNYSYDFMNRRELKEINYISMSRNDRWSNLKYFDIDCDCRACNNDPQMNNSSLRPEDVQAFLERCSQQKEAIELFGATKSLKPIIAQWKCNNEFITKYHNNPLSCIHMIQLLNKELLEKIVRAATLPF